MKQLCGKTAARILALVAIASFVAGTTCSIRAQSFEGVVEFSVTTEQGTMPMTYMAKGDDARVEMEGRPGMKAAILINVKNKKTVMLMENMKMYMDVPQPKPEDMPESNPEISKTGKMQEILGHKCEQYVIKEGDTQSEVWIAKDLGSFAMFRMGRPGSSAKEEAWQKVVGSEGGFPLKSITKSGDETVNEMIATKIEKKSLDDSLFQIPEGYKQFNPSEMRGPH
jgi:hypothetical protein